MDKLVEYNENLDTPVNLPSHLVSLKRKHQYRFFQNIILNEDTVPQIKVFSHFLLKLFRFNYQIIWEQQDQNAYNNFPQVLTETELLPSIIIGTNNYVFYIGPTSFNITYFELIHFDTNFILEHSETSDNWTYTTPTHSSEPPPDEYSRHIWQYDTGQNILHPNQDLKYRIIFKTKSFTV